MRPILFPVVLILWVSSTGVFGQSGADIGNPYPLNSNASVDGVTDDQQPSVATNKRGTWVSVWSANSMSTGGDYDLFFSRSLDNGATWTDPQVLNVNATSDTFVDDLDASVVTNGIGIWVVVWTARFRLVSSAKPIYVSRSVDNGATWDFPNALGNADNRQPSVATNGLGNWVVVWSSNDSLGGTIGTDFDILLSRSVDDGATWTAPTALNTNASNDGNVWDIGPSVGTDGHGSWVVIWDLGIARSTDDGATWTDPQPYPAGELSSLATDGLGNWLAVWGSNCNPGTGVESDIFLRRSTDNGVSWTAGAALNTNASSDGGCDLLPQVVTDGHGRWAAVWQSSENLGGTIGTDIDILMSRSTDNGATWTAPQVLNTNASTDNGGDRWPSVATDGLSSWLAVWNSDDSLGGAIGTDNDILTVRWAFCDIIVEGQEPTLIYFISAFDVVVGLLSDLRTGRDFSQASCLGVFVATPSTDSLPNPPVGDGRYYLARGRSSCVAQGYGDSSLNPDPRDALDAQSPCP